MRVKPVYAWSFSKEPADPLVTKQEREARKGVVVKGKTGKRYRVEKEPRLSDHSIMASVQSCANNGMVRQSWFLLCTIRKTPLYPLAPLYLHTVLYMYIRLRQMYIHYVARHCPLTSATTYTSSICHCISIAYVYMYAFGTAYLSTL